MFTLGHVYITLSLRYVIFTLCYLYIRLCYVGLCLCYVIFTLCHLYVMLYLHLVIFALRCAHYVMPIMTYLRNVSLHFVMGPTCYINVIMASQGFPTQGFTNFKGGDANI